MQLFQDPSAKPTIVAPRKKKLLKLRKEDGSRRFGMIALAIAVVLIGAASLRSHFVLLAKAPGDMPANAQWLLTGRDANTNMKLGLWVACWTTPTKTADHCRITDQDGAAQFDGDMLPLKAGAPVVEDKDLHIATIDPSTLWVSGVDSKQPVPLLALTNGVQLVPVWAREGLQKRMATGEWKSGSQTTFNGGMQP